MKRILILIFAITLIASHSASGQNKDTTSFRIVPRYSFYSYEKSGEIILFTPESFSGRPLSVKIMSADNTLAEWKGRPERGIARILVNLNPVAATARISAAIAVYAGTGYEMKQYSAECILTKLPAKNNEVKTDKLTGGLIVNRRQFFPFGFYCYSPVQPSLPEEETVRGFNMISPYQKITPGTLPERKAYMDRCARLGMKVHYNLLSVSGGGGVNSKIEGITEEQKNELLINEIRTFMDHPALLSWYIADEPTGNKVAPEELEKIYRTVKEIDPWHPVSIVFMAPFLSSRKYAKAVDIVMADPYPVPDVQISLVGDVTSKLSKEFRYEKPVWIVPQAFGGGELWEREPSLQEIRSMTFQAVINGATGIQFFVRQGPNGFPKSVPAWNECGRMAVEIAELTPWLLSDERSFQAESLSGDISVTTRYHNGQLLILSVNKINTPLQSTIRIAGVGTTTGRAIFENRKIQVSNGMISEPLSAFGSQAYMIEIKKSDDPNRKWLENMIKDPGFEDVSSAGVPASSYAKPGIDRGSTYFTDTREHIEGNHSLRLITPEDSSGIYLKFYPVTVEAGKSYFISIWSKADQEQRYFTVAGNGKNGVYSIGQQQLVEISLGEFGKATFVPEPEWKQFVTSFTIPADTTRKFKTNIMLKMPGQGVAWFDMLQMIEDPLK
jgi:hypothetical protein